MVKQIPAAQHVHVESVFELITLVLQGVMPCVKRLPSYHVPRLVSQMVR